jgi:hypothetical protein
VRISGVVVGLVLGAVLAGCGSSTDASGEPAGSHPRVTAQATTTPESFSGGRATLTAAAQNDEIALLERIDIGRHDGFDRVVFRFRGEDVPGYRVGFVPRPLREDGSGADVRISGAAIIGGRLEPASGFDLDAGEGTQVYEGPKRIDASRDGAEVITELARTGDFEAVLNWAIGLDRASDFRVLRLGDPPRLVVDIRS